MTSELARVMALATRRGAHVHVVDSGVWDIRKALEDDTWHESPFTSFDLAVDEKRRWVWITEKAANDPLAAGSVIHELGHLHAAPRRERIYDAEEWSWLGWELAVAREARVRRAWDDAMSDYGVGSIEELNGDVIGSEDWDHLTLREQHVVARNRAAYAKRHRMVDARGYAVWRRLPRVR